MTKSDGAATSTPMNRTQFHNAFPQLCSAFLEEWPQIEAESLSATKGEFDKVVGLIAEKTGYTKTLIRRQLEELFRIVTLPPEAGTPPGRGAAFGYEARAAAATLSDAAHEALHSVEAILEHFEKKTSHLLRELRGNVLTRTSDKLRKHWFIALLGVLGLGFIGGFLVNGLTRDR